MKRVYQKRQSGIRVWAMCDADRNRWAAEKSGTYRVMPRHALPRPELEDFSHGPANSGVSHLQIAPQLQIEAGELAQNIRSIRAEQKHNFEN